MYCPACSWCPGPWLLRSQHTACSLCFCQNQALLSTVPRPAFTYIPAAVLCSCPPGAGAAGKPLLLAPGTHCEHETLGRTEACQEGVAGCASSFFLPRLIYLGTL